MKPGSPEAKKVLQDRARVLARPPLQEADLKSKLDLLEFRLAEERYAVEISYVEEVCPFKELTPLPFTPPFIRGIVNIRGRILPVFDLKKFFGLPEKGVTDLHRIILVRGHDIELGLLADVVVGMRSIPGETLQPSLPTLAGIGSDYLKGVNEERLIVLDMARIFGDPKIIVDEEVEF